MWPSSPLETLAEVSTSDNNHMVTLSLPIDFSRSSQPVISKQEDVPDSKPAIQPQSDTQSQAPKPKNARFSETDTKIMMDFLL